MSFKPGISGNPAGRRKGQHSAKNEMLRAEETALRNIAQAAMKGDLQASIEVVRYSQNQNQ